MSKAVSKIDKLFASRQPTSSFRFDEKVAEVFPDMISRSVLGYGEIIDGIGQLASAFISADSVVYDLGCSLGAATLSIRQQVIDRNYSIVGIDNSSAMVERCQQHLNVFKSDIKTTVEVADIMQYDYQPCSLIVINFTLQFLQPHLRQKLLTKLYNKLQPGGAIILSEKLAFEDKAISKLFIKLHHEFKKNNGYSDLEISQKRAALENVLIPETKEEHFQRLQQAGFNQMECWFQHFNFSSIIAIK